MIVPWEGSKLCPWGMVLDEIDTCIMSVQYTGGCSVHWGISLSTPGGVQHTGDIMSTAGGSLCWGIS